MVYYVVYKASKDYSNRSQIPTGLRAFGCKKINKTFWGFEKEKIQKVLKLLERNQPILLKRIKEIKRRSIIHGRTQDLGTLVIVTFKVPKEKKERIRSFVRKAPCIRLCRLVYAFYQRQSQFDPKNKLVDAQNLATFIKELDGEAKIVPKIVVLNKRSMQRLVDETKQHMEKEIDDIVLKCKQVHNKCLQNRCDYRKLKEVLRRLRRQYTRAKRKARFYEIWMGLDFSRSLTKAYKTLLKLRRYSLEQRLVALELRAPSPS